MRIRASKAGALAALFAALLACAAARSDEPPVNRLSGVVVDKQSGEPAANVFVAMADEDGYLYFSGEGLQAGGDEEKVLGFFTKRNGKHFCDAVTDRAGRFTMSNFAAADGRWHIAVADPEHGWALQLNVRPQDYAERPLRVELDKPGYLVTAQPAAPAKGLRMSVSVALAPPETPAAAEGTAAGDEHRLPVYFISSGGESGAGKELRFGPLPGGHKYRLTASAFGQKLPYQATLLARTVELAPGGSEKALLEPGEGVSVTGRVTSSEDKPLAKVNVMAETAEGLVIGALTDAEGQYTLQGVPPGEHKLKLLRHAVRTLPG